MINFTMFVVGIGQCHELVMCSVNCTTLESKKYEISVDKSKSNVTISYLNWFNFCLVAIQGRDMFCTIKEHIPWNECTKMASAFLTLVEPLMERQNPGSILFCRIRFFIRN